MKKYSIIGIILIVISSMAILWSIVTFPFTDDFLGGGIAGILLLVITFLLDRKEAKWTKILLIIIASIVFLVIIFSVLVYMVCSLYHPRFCVLN